MYTRLQIETIDDKGKLLKGRLSYVLYTEVDFGNFVIKSSIVE